MSSCEDKQTKICLAKFIELISNNEQFDNDTVNAIQSHTHSEVYDISVYMMAAYTRSLSKLAEASDAPIDPLHMENLQSFELVDNLKINERDFAHDINTNVLNTLKHEAAKKKQKFEDDLFSNLIDIILYLNETYANEALDILALYTQSGRHIPSSTVVALENRLGVLLT